jgi:carboxymethylenebutenolidase
MSERVLVPVADGELPAYLWVPQGGTGPGVVLVQEIFGLSPYIHRRAADLAALGYVVVAPQVFWRLGAQSVPDGPGMLEEGIGLISRLDWPAAVADTSTAVGWLRRRSEVGDAGVGLVGFCFGGGLAYQVAAHTPVDALVSYYGSALPGLVDLLEPVSAPSLHHFGESDSYIDGPTVERIRAVVGQSPVCEFHTYPGADHAFDNPDFGMHDPQASALAWGRTVEFLGRVLPVG